MLQPLVESVATREKALRMRDSLTSMSDAVLVYKGIAPAPRAAAALAGGRAG